MYSYFNNMRKKGLIKLILLIIGLIVVLLVLIQLNNLLPKMSGKAVQTETNCVDSDNGLEYYIKGEARGRKLLNSPIETFSDVCFDNTNSEVASCDGYGCGVKESFCNIRKLVDYTTALCVNGCKNGACLPKSGEEIIEKGEEIEESEQPVIQPKPEDNLPIAEEITSQKPVSILGRIVNFFKKILS